MADALDELGARDVQSLLLEGGPHLAGAFLEAGEIDEARIFVAPVLAGGREARTVVEGLGAEAIAGAARRARDGDRADRRRRADRREAEGVVSALMFTGLVAGQGHGRGGRARRRRARACACARRSQRELAGGDSIAVNGVCLTARDPDDGSFAADLMAETLERSSLGPARRGRRGEPRAAAAGRRPPRRARRPGARGRHRGGRARGRGRLRPRGARGGAPGAAALRGREGLDRRGRRVAHRGRGGRRRASPCRSSRRRSSARRSARPSPAEP